MFFSTLSFYDNFAENVVIFVVMSLAFFQPKYLKCGIAVKILDFAPSMQNGVVLNLSSKLSIKATDIDSGWLPCCRVNYWNKK